MAAEHFVNGNCGGTLAPSQHQVGDKVGDKVKHCSVRQRVGEGDQYY